MAALVDVWHPLHPYLTLQDLLKVLQLSKPCCEIFSSPKLWSYLFVYHHMRIEAEPSKSPTHAIVIPSAPLRVAAHWKFHDWETYQGIYLDYSGNKLIAVSKFAEQLESGVGVAFSSKSRYSEEAHIEVQDPHGQLNATTTFTVEAWVMASSFKYWDYDNPVVSKHGSATGWELRFCSTGPCFVITARPFKLHEETKANIKTGVKFNQWYHIAATYDGYKVIIYLDGVEVARKVVAIQQFNDDPAPLNIGRNPNWRSRSFSGSVGEVRICHKALKPNQFLPPNASFLSSK